MKLVINRCLGGFNLSLAAIAQLVEWGDPVAIKYSDQEREYGNKPSTMNRTDHERHDPMLIRVVEKLGDAASGDCAALRIIEIPDGIEYEIDEYAGMESVHEKHRSWS